MKLKTIIELLDAKKLNKSCVDDVEVYAACGSDLMSDVLAFVKDQSVLLSGLLNPQVVRTAEMMDILCVIFVRGKEPDQAMIDLAIEKDICLMSTDNRMFAACGKLYERGLRGGESA